MCTVVIRVPEPGLGQVRLLAVRDEDPDRPWLPLGHWWPEQPQLEGIRDQLAGGAWLAHDDHRLAVLLNRAGGTDLEVPTSRGSLVLGSLTGAELPTPLTTLGFNLVEASAGGVRITSWDGGTPRITDLAPGTHMIAHEDVDDPATARIAAWLDAFAAAPTEGNHWWEAWVRLLKETAELPSDDDRAIVRDNRAHGYPTLTLLVCVATIGPEGVTAEMATFDEPGRWNDLDLSGADGN